MKYLTRDEICGLEKFLVADNEEAVGIEIHIGGDWRRGYPEPHTIRKYSLEELSGGELIPLEDQTLCALVGDQLYYKDNQRGFVEATGAEYAYRGVSRQTGDYLYQRAMVSYCSPIVTLPPEEILSLDTILVKNNHRVVGVKLIHGFSGIGGSNNSGFGAEPGKEIVYTAEELDGRKPIRVEDDMICALANDVLHFRYRSYNGEMRTFTLDYRKRTYIARGDGIAYDTVSATKVVLILKE